jgi:hypothetical protein
MAGTVKPRIHLHYYRQGWSAFVRVTHSPEAWIYGVGTTAAEAMNELCRRWRI